MSVNSITLRLQLDNLANAIDNADGEADFTASLAYRENPALCEDLYELEYELRQLRSIVTSLKARETHRQNADDHLPAGV